MEDKMISTRDVNEVARIHSNPEYINWKMEYVDGEYRFYSPEYKKENTVVFYHGGAEPNFSLEQLDVLRPSQKQQNANGSYAGFYMYSEKDRDGAYHYSEQENSIKGTDTKGVVKLTLDANLRIYEVPPFSITRLTQEQIQTLQQQGYDLVAGKVMSRTEYVLLNKDKIKGMEFESMDMRYTNNQEQIKEEVVAEEQKDTYLTMEQLAPILSEQGYICLGHGTGRSGNDENVVDSIFQEGLRTKDNSLYFTTIGLDTPTPEIIKSHEELGIEPPSISAIENQFNNWQHQDSKKIIIARVPTEYINYNGNRSDLDGEMFGAFMDEELGNDGKTTNYLNPAFIIGCYDVDKKAVRLNKSFERTLSEQTLSKVKSRYKKALEKTQKRLKSIEDNLPSYSEMMSELQQETTMQEQIIQNQEMISDFGEDIDWGFPSLEEEHHKSR